MPIEFLCPNGHRLSCADDKAGQTGKCPKCGAGFRIPQRGGGQARRSDSQESYPELEDLAHTLRGGPPPAPPEAAPPQQSAPLPADTFWFLCPNGHKLNGPARLQGKPGRCPHCGAKFLIPAHDDLPAEDALPEEASTYPEFPQFAPPPYSPPQPASVPAAVASPPAPAAVASPTYAATNGAQPALQNAEEDELNLGLTVSDSGIQSASTVGVAPASAIHSAGAHPMAALFLRLWRERSQGAAFEVYTKDGATINPEWFAERFPQPSLAVFASHDVDGGVMLTSVPWESIARVVVRGVQTLPPGMFD